MRGKVGTRCCHYEMAKMGYLHFWTTVLVWLRTTGAAVMFVIMILNLALTGGIGWYVFDTDKGEFMKILGDSATPGIYNDKDWFKPMCPGSCTETFDGIGSGDDMEVTTFTKNVVNDYPGCSQNYDWSACSSASLDNCETMHEIIPQHYKNEGTDVFVMQNVTHLCLSGMNLASDPLATWRDCLIYRIENKPEGRLSIMFYSNWVFMFVLALALIAEFVFHHKFMHKGQIRFMNREKHRNVKHFVNVFYHMVVGIFSIMLAGLTVDVQTRYEDEMSPAMIQEVETLKGEKFHPFDSDKDCFKSDTGMLVWNSAMGLHKASKHDTLEADKISEYTLIYIIFLFSFGFIYFCAGVLLACVHEDPRSRRQMKNYGREYVQSNPVYDRPSRTMFDAPPPNDTDNQQNERLENLESEFYRMNRQNIMNKKVSTLFF